MFELLTFRFASPGLTDWTSATVVHPVPTATPPVVGTLTISGQVVPLDKLAEFRAAARELLDQPTDGVTDTVKLIDGTSLTLTLSADRSTLQIGGGPAYPRAKFDDGLLAALVGLGLLPALP